VPTTRASTRSWRRSTIQRPARRRPRSGRFLAAIGGDCHTPLAAHAVVHGAQLEMRALVAGLDGREIVGDVFSGPVASAAEIGRRIAAGLLSRGAAALIARAEAGYA
jgi:porphobilinogen deaminase